MYYFWQLSITEFGMCTRSKRKRVFAVVRYRLACWLNMVVFVNHIWRRGSRIEHTESTPKGFEGISDFGFLSEAFSAKTTAISPPHFRASEVHRDGNAGPRWKKWLGKFEILTIGMRISDEKQIRALFLHYGGTEVDEIFDTLQDVGEDKDYRKAVNARN